MTTLPITHRMTTMPITHPETAEAIKAETQEKDTQLIKDLHTVLARLRDTPCVKGYPGLDDLLLRSAARIEL